MGGADVHGKDKNREGTALASSNIRASRRHALKLQGAGGLAFAAPAIIRRSPARAQTATPLLMDGFPQFPQFPLVIRQSASGDVAAQVGPAAGNFRN